MKKLEAEMFAPAPQIDRSETVCISYTLFHFLSWLICLLCAGGLISTNVSTKQGRKFLKEKIAGAFYFKYFTAKNITAIVAAIPNPNFTLGVKNVFGLFMPIGCAWCFPEYGKALLVISKPSEVTRCLFFPKSDCSCASTISPLLNAFVGALGLGNSNWKLRAVKFLMIWYFAIVNNYWLRQIYDLIFAGRIFSFKNFTNRCSYEAAHPLAHNV